MKERYSDEKLINISKEDEFINFEWIDDLSGFIVNKLTAWANEKIFKPIGGVLTCDRKAIESVNASAQVDPKNPTNAHIMITMGMVREIYRDSFVFTLLSEKFALDSDNIKILNEEFKNAPFTFETGIPEVSAAARTEIAKIFLEAVGELQARREELTENVITARFSMFELVLSWVFFHELSHIVQRHYLLKTGPNNNVIEEMESSSGDEIENPLSQAREILADVEAVDLTLKYMAMNHYFTYSNSYLFMFGLCLMFHRFYRGCGDNFDSVPGSHPHPVVRYDFTQSYFMMAIMDYLLKSGDASSKESAALPLAYTTIRASLVAGILWSHRYDKKRRDSLHLWILALKNTRKAAPHIKTVCERP